MFLKLLTAAYVNQPSQEILVNMDNVFDIRQSVEPVGNDNTAIFFDTNFSSPQYKREHIEVTNSMAEIKMKLSST